MGQGIIPTPPGPPAGGEQQGGLLPAALDAMGDVLAANKVLADRVAALEAESAKLREENHQLRESRYDDAENDRDHLEYRLRDEYHEDDGPVVWFAFDEDGWPELHFGSLIDSIPPEPQFTRWVKPPILTAKLCDQFVAEQRAALASSSPAGESTRKAGQQRHE